MAQNPVNPPMPADLPTDWTYGQTVAPTGAEAGLPQTYGFNYLMQQVNDAQAMINKIGAAIAALSAADVNAVPNTRTVNGKALSADVTLSAADVKARPETWTPTAADVGALASGGTAAAATKLATARTIRTNLASTSAASFNGTANVTPGVSGVLPVANGGTGGSSVAASTYAPKENPVFTGSISMGRKAGTTIGAYSVAVGLDCEASDARCHAEGVNTRATAGNSHAEGSITVASGASSHAEGAKTTASAFSSHAEGETTTAAGNCSHAEGYFTKASGLSSHAEGHSTTASMAYSHAEGYLTKASGNGSHAEGEKTTAFEDSSHAEGYETIAANFASHSGGKYSKEMTTGGTSSNTTGDAMVIGNGASRSNRSNCFRVTYAGAVYGVGSFHTTGADYAEFFEWADGNPDAEDRVGRFVTMDGPNIRTASPGDYLLGIVSGNPCIIGNGDEDWLGRWVHDEFDRFVKEYLEEDREEIEAPEDEEDRMRLLADPEIQEEDGKYYRVTARVVDHETPSWRLKANPDYDHTQAYVERKDRKEWDTVGMLGVLAVRDDGTCQVNGYCRCAEGGIATAAEAYIPGQTYRVLARVSDSVVKVVFR